MPNYRLEWRAATPATGVEGGAMKRTFVATALAICVSCSHGPQLRQITRPWLEVSSAHFSLRTDLDEADARRAAGQLEEVRSVMLRAGLGQSTDDGAKVRVVVFAERKDLASFAGDRSFGSIERGVQIERAVGFHSLDLEYTLDEDGHVHAVHAVDPAAPARVYFAAAEWLRWGVFSPAKTSSGEPVAVRMRTVFRIGE
jgi:hypothetical protein